MLLNPKASNVAIIDLKSPSPLLILPTRVSILPMYASRGAVFKFSSVIKASLGIAVTSESSWPLSSSSSTPSRPSVSLPYISLIPSPNSIDLAVILSTISSKSLPLKSVRSSLFEPAIFSTARLALSDIFSRFPDAVSVCIA